MSDNRKYYLQLAADIERRNAMKVFETPVPTKDAVTPLPVKCRCGNPATVIARDVNGRVVYYYAKSQFSHKPICQECHDKYHEQWNYDRDSSN